MSLLRFVLFSKMKRINVFDIYKWQNQLLFFLSQKNDNLEVILIGLKNVLPYNPKWKVLALCKYNNLDNIEIVI